MPPRPIYIRIHVAARLKFELSLQQIAVRRHRCGKNGYHAVAMHAHILGVPILMRAFGRYSVASTELPGKDIYVQACTSQLRLGTRARNLSIQTSGHQLIFDYLTCSCMHLNALRVSAMRPLSTSQHTTYIPHARGPSLPSLTEYAVPSHCGGYTHPIARNLATGEHTSPLTQLCNLVCTCIAIANSQVQTEHGLQL